MDRDFTSADLNPDPQCDACREPMDLDTATCPKCGQTMHVECGSIRECAECKNGLYCRGCADGHLVDMGGYSLCKDCKAKPEAEDAAA